MKYYSKQTNRLYDTNVTRHIPKDKIPITEDLYTKILEAVSEGQELRWDERSELPVTSFRRKYAQPLDQQLESLHRYYESYMRRYISVSFEILIHQKDNDKARSVIEWKDSLWADYDKKKVKVLNDMMYFSSADLTLNHLGKPSYTYQEVARG